MKMLVKRFGLGVTLASIVSVFVILCVSVYIIDSQNSDLQESETSVEDDPTASWEHYVDPAGFFEFKYPKSLSLKTDLSFCSASRLPKATCVSDTSGTVIIEVADGQLLRSNYELLEPNFSDIKSESYFIDGVASFKQKANMEATQQNYPDLVVGDKIIIYIFQKGEHTYALRYKVAGNNESIFTQSDFETMVNKTFKFKK